MAVWFCVIALLVQVSAFSLRRSSHVVQRQDACRGVYYDGFSRVACEVDVAPQEQRLYFKEHACVGMPPGSSCRLQTLGMTPTLCFDFCRQYKEMKFFGIEHGRDCYCGGYFHPKSTGGQGTCNLPCEGDSKEMCGGPDKSSLFEMHFCDASAGRLEMVKGMAKEAKEAAAPAKEDAEKVFAEAKALSDAWQLGVCSLKPQGELVCSLNKAWVDMGSEANNEANEVDKAVDVLEKAEKSLEEAEKAVTDAGDEVTGELQGKQDKAVQAVKESSVSVTAKADGIKTSLSSLAGPINSDKVMKNFEDFFEALGDTEKKWHAVCALEPIKGQSYIGLDSEKESTGKASCASKCFSLVTGTDQCVGFNYQSINGLAACQLLTEKGLTKPVIAKAVPIFEVSQSKIDAMKLSALDCYTKKAFMGSHPAGPLKVEVVKQVTVDR